LNKQKYGVKMDFKQSPLGNLEPTLVWKFFYELTQTPRPSKKEEKVRNYLKNLAKENNIDFSEDELGNIVFRIPATPGYENNPTVVLQGHVDMVCEKNKDVDFDFDNQPINVYIDGEYVKAKGTTLGADNGIGVASAIAIAFDKDSVHGPLELLFTVDEETGLTGAQVLKPDFVKGRILLNLDSEEHGTFFVGCAGGQDTKGVLKIEFTELSDEYETYDLMISGLKGGHSGLDIKIGRANAIKLLARMLDKLYINNVDFYISDIQGGSKHNAIPREAEVKLHIKANTLETVNTLVKEFEKESLMEYKRNDGDLKVSITKIENSKKAYTKELTQKIVRILLALPHGVISMSPDISGLVETSTNLATVVSNNEKIIIGTSQRSSVEPAKYYIFSCVRSIFELAGCELLVGDGYPAWQPNLDSEVLKTAVKCYKELENSEPKIEAIHAGLECGIIGAKYPGMDMISFGPTMHNVHSPDEKLNIPSVQRYYNLLKQILKSLAQ